MDNITLIESFADFKDDKLIDRVTLMAILEEVFREPSEENTAMMKILM